MRKISREKQLEVRYLLSTNNSVSEIARQVGISVGSVSTIRKSLGIETKKNGGGRPSLLKAPHLRHLFRLALKPKALTARELADSLRAETGVTAHPQTVRRCMKSFGLVNYSRAFKPRLLKKHKVARLKWAKQMRGLTQGDWDSIVFTDETKINRLGPDGPNRVWRLPGPPTQNHHFRETVKFGGGSVMVWGAITPHGVGGLVRIPTTMDAEVFCETLDAGLSLTLSKYQLAPDQIILQQDNDPKHCSRKAKQWISEHNLQVLPWPSCSPDLNPIENVWRDVKRRVASHEEKPANLDELFSQTLREWNMTSPDYIRALYNSMHRRIEAVIKAKGGHTKY